MKTAVVEKGNTGGRCLNEACIPAKAILRVAEVMQEVQHADQYGISAGKVSFDYAGRRSTATRSSRRSRAAWAASSRRTAST